jgi:prepilin-type N-terminal cleavage/methylation domain-containing protein
MNTNERWRLARLARRANNQRGFTALELLIVALLIVLLAAIAIPSLTGSKRAANESLVKSRLASFAASQVTYRSAIGKNRYATLLQLRTTTAGGVPLIPPNEVDATGNPIANGGWILSQLETPTDTTFGAGMTTTYYPTAKHYCVFEDGVVRVDCCNCTRSSTMLTSN